MGPLTFGKKEEQIFLGREIAQHQDYSEDTALKIDHEVKRFVTDNYTRANDILVQHKAKLIDMAEALLLRETLDAEQVRRIVGRRSARGSGPGRARDAAGRAVGPEGRRSVRRSFRSCRRGRLPRSRCEVRTSKFEVARARE